MKLPPLLQRVFHQPKPLLKEVDGANLFASIGSNSLPYAIALLNHKSVTVRRSAAWALGSIRGQTHSAKEAIPALTAALSDPDRMVRFHAALSLKEFGPEASNAVPALTRVLASATNNDFYVRAVAALSLGKIGPAASNAVPPLKAGAHESLPYFRGVCAVAIWRITADTENTLPVILAAMPETMPDSKWDWIIALGEMGSRARPAVTQLTNEMRQLQWERQSWILGHITNALRRIDPEVAAKLGIHPEPK